MASASDRATTWRRSSTSPGGWRSTGGSKGNSPLTSPQRQQGNSELLPCLRCGLVINQLAPSAFHQSVRRSSVGADMLTSVVTAPAALELPESLRGGLASAGG